MEDTTILNLRRFQPTAAEALIEAFAALRGAARRVIACTFAALAEHRQRARARMELRSLSSHLLRDIGLEPDQVERLFH
jgi:uncharacterized protein YjiS (DUF1127 family)